MKIIEEIDVKPSANLEKKSTKAVFSVLCRATSIVMENLFYIMKSSFKYCHVLA